MESGVREPGRGRVSKEGRLRMVAEELAFSVIAVVETHLQEARVVSWMAMAGTG